MDFAATQRTRARRLTVQGARDPRGKEADTGEFLCIFPPAGERLVKSNITYIIIFIPRAVSNDFS